MIRSPYEPLKDEQQQYILAYLYFCRGGKLNDGPRQKSDSPKVSIVIPMYNEQSHITFILRSIQNQSLRDIEIVCVDDCSTDSTSSMLKKFQEEDPRITIIKNRKNRGVIYSRIYGALHSKGEYITYADADDAYCHPKALENIYAEAIKDKVEICHYQGCGGYYDGEKDFKPISLFNTFNPFIFNQVLHQPEIRDNYYYNKRHVTGSTFVFDKFYSRSCIKKIADLIGEDVWNQHLIFVDDFLLAFAAMRCCESFKMINELAYWHWRENEESVTNGNVFGCTGAKLDNPVKSNKKIQDYMIIKETMFNITEDDKNASELREEILRDLEKPPYLIAIGRSIHFERLLNLYNRLMNWKYVTPAVKERVRKGGRFVLQFGVDLRFKYDNFLEADEQDKLKKLMEMMKEEAEKKEGKKEDSK